MSVKVNEPTEAAAKAAPVQGAEKQPASQQKSAPQRTGGATSHTPVALMPNAARRGGAAAQARNVAAMQRSMGNVRLSRMLNSAASRGALTPDQPAQRNGNGGFQMLSVSQPDSPSEREAETVAQHVAAGQPAPPIKPVSPSEIHPVVQPEEGKKKEAVEESAQTTTPQHQEKETEHAHLAQREATGPAHESMDTSAASSAVANKGAGSPVHTDLRRSLEPRMGADLSAARVHNDNAANKAAESINARAFTHGSDIFLARNESERDTRLMAHELTHVVQQTSDGAQSGAPSARLVSRKENAAAHLATAKESKGAGAKAAAEELVAPGVLDLQGMKEFTPPTQTEQFLEEHKGKEVVVKTRFGKMAEGDLRVKKGKGDDYQIKRQALPLRHPLFARISEALPGLEPSLIVTNRKNQVVGFIGIAAAAKLPSDESLANYIEKAPDLIGLAGFSVPNVKLTNKLEGGQLRLGLSNVPIKLGAAFKGTVTFEVVDEKVTFEGNATVDVKGLATGTLELKRNEEGLITGKVAVALQLPKNFTGAVDVAWDGHAITGEGKVGYTGEKLSGEITLRLMEKGEATQLEKEKKAPPEDAGKVPAAAAPAKGEGKKPKAVDYVVSGEGDLTFAFNEWLNGTAHVIVDQKGYVTIIGKITPQKEFNLFGDPPQKEWVKQLFKLEARATYGLPVVGNIFIFANVSLDAFAKLGPAKFYNIVVEGTYSTDPEKCKDFSIKGSINISAAAGVRLRAEAGAGIEILSHDIKAGAGINGIAGIKAYAEATPVVGYREKPAAEGEDKKGEFFIRGDLEIAAQPFLGLSGDLFIELSTPWWSPLSDDKWTWPLFNKEYPIGGSIGMLASVDYVFGSGKWPSLELKPVEFDSEKFMTDMYHDNAKPKSGELGDQQGQWKEKNEAAAEPPKEEATKGNAVPGKLGELPPAKPTVAPGGPKTPKKEADPHAKTAEGKSVKELQDEAAKKGKKPAGKDPKTGEEKPAHEPEVKDPTKKEHDEQLKKGLAALDASDARYSKVGATKEEAEAAAAEVQKKHKVFKSIEVIDAGKAWKYKYVASDGELTGPPKADAHKPDGSKEKPYWIFWHKPHIGGYPDAHVHTEPGGPIKSVKPTEDTPITIRTPTSEEKEVLTQLKIKTGDRLRRISNLLNQLRVLESLKQKYDEHALEEAQNNLNRANEELASLTTDSKEATAQQKKIVKLGQQLNQVRLALEKIEKMPEVAEKVRAAEEELDKFQQDQEKIQQDIATGKSGTTLTKTIGVGNNKLSDDDVVGPRTKAPPRKTEKEFKEFMANAGHDLAKEKQAPDHVREIGLGGSDTFDNLWPLPSSENIVPPQRIDLTTGKQVGMEETSGKGTHINDLIGKWFRIKGFGKKS